MASDFAIGQGDLGEALVATLADYNGPYSLVGATVTFHMVRRSTGEVVVNAPAIIDPDQIAHKGRVSYTWQSGDTSIPGDYLGEFRVLVGGTLPTTFPNGARKLTITIEAALV